MRFRKNKLSKEEKMIINQLISKFKKIFNKQ